MNQCGPFDSSGLLHLRNEVTPIGCRRRRGVLKVMSQTDGNEILLGSNLPMRGWTDGCCCGPCSFRSCTRTLSASVVNDHSFSDEVVILLDSQAVGSHSVDVL